MVGDETALTRVICVSPTKVVTAKLELLGFNPLKIIELINANAYRVNLDKHARKHNVINTNASNHGFHGLNLKHFKGRTSVINQPYIHRTPT